MQKKYLIKILILIMFVIFLGYPTSVNADELPIPHDYIQDVGENYVFVMLSPYDPSIFAENIQDVTIRSKYDKSGLYAKGKHPILLWAVDWYEYKYGVEISFDGKHLVRWETLLSYATFDHTAFTLYENGQEIKEYAINDLVAFPFLLSAPFEWKKHSFFDKEQKQLSIQTSNGERYTIDVTTGEIVNGVRPKMRRMHFVFGWSFLILVMIFAARKFFKPVNFQERT